MPRGIPGSGKRNPTIITPQEEIDINNAVERVKLSRRNLNPGYEPLRKGSYAERLDNARRTLKHMRDNLDDILTLVLVLQENRSLALLDSTDSDNEPRKRKRRKKNNDVSESDGRKKGRGRRKAATEKL